MTEKRLYIVTGKGGVGKTSVALALAQKIKNESKKVLYIDFEDGFQKDYINKNSIDYFRINLVESLREYISRKLHSTMIASWITKAPFFISLVNMVPGFSYLINLGNIIDMLKNDPELIIVLDSPASGHALTMFESTYNFKNIFKSGILFQDAKMMIEYGYDPKNLEVIICSLPTEMALTEAVELKSELATMGVVSSKILLNQSLIELKQIENQEFPSLIQNKITNEEKLIEDFKDQINFSIPYIGKNNSVEVTSEIVRFVEKVT